MAALEGANYTNNYSTNPPVRGKAGEIGGVKRVMFDQSAAGVAADTIKLGKLPKGARILNVSSVGAGSGASFNVAAGDLIAAETILTLTVGTSPSLPISGWAEYVID